MELTASISGIICVFLVIRRNILCWSVGLVQVVLYIYIFFRAKLYSDALLHVVYVFMQLYGWWNWTMNKKESKHIQIIVFRYATFMGHIFLAAVGTWVLGWLMTRYTDASFAYADAFTTVASLIAQWLLTRRYFITWYFWISVDVVAILIYWQKHLYPTAVLYLLFFAMACIGLTVWRREIRKNACELQPVLVEAT